MNKIFNYILVLAAAGALFASCKKEVQDVYTPGKPDQADCYGVYFPVQDASGAHTYDPSMDRELTVKVSRSKEQPYIDDAITVPYIVTSSEEGIFECGDIVFDSAQSETTFTIKFPTAGEGVNYSLNLQISDPKYASVYTASKTSFDFSVMVVSWQYILNPATNQPALFEFTQDWWGETAWAYIKYYEVGGVRTCFTETQSKHYYNDFYEGYGFLGTAETPEEATEWSFRMYMENKNGEGNYLIELPAQYCGYTDSAGYDRYVSDVLWYYIYKGDLTEDEWLSNAIKSGDPDGSYPCGYYDGNGGIYLYTIGYYRETLAGSWTQSYDVIGIGEGFVRTDYSIEVESDYSSEGSTPVSIETGKDVSYIKYAVYPGELTAPQAANKAPLIIDGTDESVKFDEFTLDEEENIKYATLLLAPETSGLYTFVAVTFNEKDEAQETAFVGFYFVAAEDEEANAVKVQVGTEDISARYEAEGLNKINAFSYWISGEDLIDVHATILTAAAFEKDPEAALLALKSNTKAAASEEQLAAINGAGGISLIANNLAPLTEYVVLVWATNGKLETGVYASYTTDGLPLELVCTGTYSYASWWEGDDDEQQLFTDPNYENTYVLTNWGGGVDFKFTIDPATKEITIPMFFIGASHSSYGAVYYVEARDYYSEQSIAADPTKGEPSYLDENGVYHFHFALVVSAGTFGHFWETFTPEGTDAPAEAPALAALASSSNLEMGLGKIEIPATRFIVGERNPQPVKVAAKVSAERKQKESSKNFDVTAR